MCAWEGGPGCIAMAEDPAARSVAIVFGIRRFVRGVLPRVMAATSARRMVRIGRVFRWGDRPAK